MDGNFQRLKEIIGSTLKKLRRRSIIGGIAVIVGIALIAGILDIITLDDGGYKEDDKKNVPNNVGQHTADISIDSNGNITTGKSAKELWDEMIANGSRVNEYLDGPEELLKMMNAEMVTNYLDTRPDPSKSIDWKKLNKDINSKAVQGIIKLKRADNNGNTSYMTYVDYSTFYAWLEEYNISGNAAVKEKLLKHFTLESKATGSTNTKVTLDYSGNNQWTDISEAIVNTAFESYNTQNSPGAGLCQAWVYRVYRDAGLGEAGYIGAYQAFQATCVSTDRTNIPIGAAVYGTGSASFDGGANIYGHVGIYIGDTDGDGEGEVMDNIGDITIQPLSSWIAWQENAGNTACGGTPGWLGWGWQSGGPKRFLTEAEIKETEKRLNTTGATKVVTNENGGQTGTKTLNAIVATWNETTEKVESDDPEVENKNETIYNMTATRIDYQSLVKGYKMPFDYLWAFLVVGQEKGFIFDLAELIYNSQIEITVHDNLTIDTDVTTSTRTVEVEIPNTNPTATKEVTYTTKNTVITKTNTLDTKLTRANVWIVDYKQEFTYVASEGSKKYVSSPANITEKTDKQAKEPNFVTIYLKYRKLQNNMDSAAEWLFQILEKGPNTADMLDLTKYLLYKATGHNYGVTEYDFGIYDASKFKAVSTDVSDLLRAYIRKWEHGTPPPTNADGTKYIIESDPVGNIAVGYGIDIFNGGYADLFRKAGYPTSVGGEVDKEFVDSLEKQTIESMTEKVRAATAGLNLQEYQIHALVSRSYNCGVGGAITTRRGELSLNFVKSYDKYWEEEKEKLFEKKDNNANFSHSLYTQYMSKPVTANGEHLPGLVRRRKSEWRLFQTGYYDTLDQWYQEGGRLVSAAYKVADHFIKGNIHYAGNDVQGAANNGRHCIYGNIQGSWDKPIEKPDQYGVVCATYVSLSIWKAGLIDEATINKYGYNICSGIVAMLTKSSYASQWKKISKYEELQSGDIVFHKGYDHVYIYVGDGKCLDQNYCVISSSGSDYRGQLLNASASDFKEAYRYVGK